ncbi:MAG: DUF937 domain-containing protein [Gemmatimonadota bacterium]|nr:DUF937 domain-containing protein [Gemmatimonadota bacterium]MDH4350624.1 DUF937 domain-containing protein [Gemmatimonadota bacterium]MDH5197731.1 DUF937 domain-containing protein [Gemmatimonadota bacterium]
MSNLLESLAAQLGGSSVQGLAKTIGADPATTQKALGAALPFLVSALAKNAATPQGAQALHQALAKDHDGSVLDNLGGFMSKPDTQAGDGILRHVLGDRRQMVEAGIGKASGLDGQGVSTLMATLAPVVMGMLGRTQRQQGLDTSALTQMLQGEQQRAAAPALGGLAKLLDADGDGQVMDDIAKMGGNLLGGLFGKRGG